MALGLKLGPYHVLTPIGKGGMGMVYLGVDSRNQQHVAVKVLSPQRKREGERHIARFLREMEMSKNLLHPNLVVARDLGDEQGVHYLVMEYIAGQTLYRLVSTQGPLTVPRAAHLFSEVAAAMDYAHGQGLIHRDLKPANIMVTPNDHAKVLDLGLAMMEGEAVDDSQVIGGKGHVVGSFDYIAPEQTRDAAAVDGRADIYSLGCSLYFSLTGRPPFPMTGAKDKIQAHRHLQPEAVEQHNPRVPIDFAALVHVLMSKSPDHRPQTMAEVRTKLLAWTSPDDKPMDKESDPPVQAAIAALESAPVGSDTATDVWNFGGTQTSSFSRNYGGDDSRYKLLAISVAAIWGLVFLLVALIYLLG